MRKSNNANAAKTDEFRNGEKNMSENQGTIRTIMDAIKKIDGTEEQKTQLAKALLRAKNQKVNLMITGATGVGKSSTINALFDMEKARVGVDSEPETMGISKYELESLTIWDTPGLGDGKEKDICHSKKIMDTLLEVDENGDPVIDLVLVILDAASRDLGTSYELINQVIIRTLGKEAEGRVLIALNKADEANGGLRNWDLENNCPKEATMLYLEEQRETVRRRVKESTGVDVRVVSYKAGYTDPVTGKQERPWNLAALLDYIVEYTPAKKRIALVENVNGDPAMWEDSEELEEHRQSILEKVVEGLKTAFEIVTGIIAIGKALGELFSHRSGGDFPIF